MRAWIFVLAIGCDGTIDLLPDADVVADAGSDAPCDAACEAGCFDLMTNALHCGDCTRSCMHHQICNAGSCECLPGMILCNGSCIDPHSDPDHCGGCPGAICQATDKCDNGHCGPSCSPGKTACPVGPHFACVDLDSGIPYCGACGKVCAVGETCIAGNCQH